MIHSGGVKINMHTAELIGLHIGDGTLYKSRRGIVWELRGNLDEKEYYDTHVRELVKNCCSMDIAPKFRSGGKHGCYGLQTSRKEVISFFINAGFQPGRKSHNVRIPAYILKADNCVKFAFIRGLFDSDGCFRLDRINKSIIPNYPRIEFQTASQNLRDDLRRLVDSLGFTSHIWGRKYFCICLPGKTNLARFTRCIKPKSGKFSKKLGVWKDFVKKEGISKIYKKGTHSSLYAEVAQPGTARTSG